MVEDRSIRQKGDQPVAQQQEGKKGTQQAQPVRGDESKPTQTASQGSSKSRPRYANAVLLAAFLLVVGLIVIGIAGVLAWTIVIPCIVVLAGLAGYLANR